MTRTSFAARLAATVIALLLGTAVPSTALSHEGEKHAADTLNVQVGAFHMHLVALDKGFEVHVHDVAKHLPVDLAKAKTRATLLVDGKTTVLPLSVKAKGILSGATPLPPRWTLLVMLNVPGQKPATARFSAPGAKAHVP